MKKTASRTIWCLDEKIVIPKRYAMVKCTAALLAGGFSCFGAPAGDLLVRHDRPSANWREADPLGNGRLGAMVWGGTVTETINLNEDTLWSGEPEPHTDGKRCRDHLSEVRKLIFADREADAYNLANRTMSGRYNQCYQPLGVLTLAVPAAGDAVVSDYRRQLDISKALHGTRFVLDDVTYGREVFISHPDDVMVVRVSASRRQSVDLDVSLDTLLKGSVSGTGKRGELMLSGRAPIHATPHYAGTEVVYDDHRGMRFAGLVRAIPQGGTCTVEGDTIQLRGCDDVVLLCTAATSYNGFDTSPSGEGKNEKALAAQTLEKAAARSFAELKERHLLGPDPSPQDAGTGPGPRDHAGATETRPGRTRVLAGRLSSPDLRQAWGRQRHVERFRCHDEDLDQPEPDSSFHPVRLGDRWEPGRNDRIDGKPGSEPCG